MAELKTCLICNKKFNSSPRRRKLCSENCVRKQRKQVDKKRRSDPEYRKWKREHFREYRKRPYVKESDRLDRLRFKEKNPNYHANYYQNHKEKMNQQNRENYRKNHKIKSLSPI